MYIKIYILKKKKQNHRCRKSYGYQGGSGGRDKLGDWD